MKRKLISCITGLILGMTILFSGCSSKSASDMSTGTGKADVSFDSASGGTADTTAEAVASEPVKEGGKTDQAEDVRNSAALTSENAPIGAQDKIIVNYNLTVETQDFDDLIKNINTKITQLGGYVENSQINGKSYYKDYQSRSANIVARIPSKKTDDFVGNVSEAANVINNQKSSENVSLQYIDAKSKMDALKIEQERLFAILEKTDKLDNIITLESRLSDIRYEIQNFESQLRSYDNQVDYSTVTLNIQEVERITPVSVVKPTLLSRISSGFSNTLYNISEGFQNFLVWFIVNLPYLLIWGVIIWLIVMIIRRYLRKKNIKQKNFAAGILGENTQLKQKEEEQQSNKEQK
jgi:hypothetical protein